MTRYRAAIATIVLVMLLAGLVVSRLIEAEHAGPVYTVSQLSAGLARQPVAWLGRTVQVRGMVWYGVCPPNADCPPPLPPVIEDGGPLGPHGGPSLLVANVPLVSTTLEDTRLNWLRSIPILGQLVPGAQQVVISQNATYHIRLQRCSVDLCYFGRYEALLLDVSPHWRISYDLFRVSR